jgi:hypothetical protein
MRFARDMPAGHDMPYGRDMPFGREHTDKPQFTSFKKASRFRILMCPLSSRQTKKQKNLQIK